MGGSNSRAALDALAFEARRNWRLSVENWMQAAGAVAEARDLCEHGEWRPWLAKTGIPETTSRRMLTIARAGLEMRQVAHLGIARTVDLLQEIPAEMIEDHGAAGALAIYPMAKAVARLILDSHAEGDWQTANAMLAAMPETVADADSWRSWSEEIVAASKDGDRDRIGAAYDRRPWREVPA